MENPRYRAFRTLGRVLLGLALLGGAAGLSYLIQSSEPKAEREAATRKTAAPVTTIIAQRGTHTPTIRVLGVVQPAREIVLSPRVGGEIVAVDAAFRPGGRVRKGAPLLELDPADHEQHLVMRESELGQIKAELAIEEGQQRAAQLEFELLGKDMDPANQSLVLREPQIAALRSKLRGAEASVKRAQLDLARTRIAAPFDAMILERHVELGSQVAAGDRLARLVGTDEYWIVATVPLGSIRWIRFPGEGGTEEGGTGASARVLHPAVWPEGQHRQGRVERLIGEVDDETRLARVIVSVRRPLGGDGEPTLILGSAVRVEIEARSIENVVRLDRAYLRRGNTVWVMEDQELRLRTADVVFMDSTHVYIRDGVADGDKVVTTDLATVVEGLPIRDVKASER